MAMPILSASLRICSNSRPRLGGEIAVEIVVQLDAVEAGVFRQAEALFE